MQSNGNKMWDEIARQPDLWLEVFASLSAQREQLTSFIAPCLKGDIIVTGVGAYARAGDFVSGLLQEKWGTSVRSVATTDLLINPTHHLQLNSLQEARSPLLLISCVPTGNKPESIAAVQLVSHLHPDARHLILTYNPDGTLTNMSVNHSLKLLLPESGADDAEIKTGSLSGLVEALLLLGDCISVDPQVWTNAESLVKLSAKTATGLLAKQETLSAIAQVDFKRLICLGSGPLLGLANDILTKTQQATNGNISGAADSYLGFRHNSHVLMDDDTLVLFLLNPDPYVARYEADVIDWVARDFSPLQTVGIGPQSPSLPVDELISFPVEKSALSWLSYFVPGQLLAWQKALALESSETPIERNSHHRTTRGVKIYPFGKS